MDWRVKKMAVSKWDIVSLFYCNYSRAGIILLYNDRCSNFIFVSYRLEFKNSDRSLKINY